MSSSASKRLAWIGPVLFAVAAVGGCAEPDLYLDRRDTISLHAGDAVAANIAPARSPRRRGSVRARSTSKKSPAAATPEPANKAIPRCRALARQPSNEAQQCSIAQITSSRPRSG